MTKTVLSLVRSGEEFGSAQGAHASAHLQPVKRLMLAVLDRAIDDFRTYGAVPTGRGRRLFSEIDEWFHSSADGPFEFETICEATGLDPGCIRRRLRSPSA
jgi:hypothetical protein